MPTASAATANEMPAWAKKAVVLRSGAGGGRGHGQSLSGARGERLSSTTHRHRPAQALPPPQHDPGEGLDDAVRSAVLLALGVDQVRVLREQRLEVGGAAAGRGQPGAPRRTVGGEGAHHQVPAGTHGSRCGPDVPGTDVRVGEEVEPGRGRATGRRCGPGTQSSRSVTTAVTDAWRAVRRAFTSASASAETSRTVMSCQPRSRSSSVSVEAPAPTSTTLLAGSATDAMRRSDVSSSR